MMPANMRGYAYMKEWLNVKASLGAFSILILLVFSLIVLVSSGLAQQRYWIVFKDKDIDRYQFHRGNKVFEEAKASLSIAAIRRRMTAEGLTADEVVTLEDAQLSPLYLSSIRQLGIRPHIISRWANAASAPLDADQLERVKAFSFVDHVAPVACSKLSVETKNEPIVSYRAVLPFQNVDTVCDYNPVVYHYGYAQSQLDRINVWPLHAMGFDATNVTLGFLDTGFKWRELSSLMSKKVLFEHDYIFNDSVTENQTGDVPDQQTHGTSTLCTATGYQPDSVIGPAYNVNLLLAKTEDIRSETPREEDNYAAALEDFEARGVQVTSSSVGYFGFDSGWTSYTRADLNGRTTITAKALARAARLGVLCVTANGNNGSDHMLTPADADSILSVGALDVNDSIASFSSQGPTADGRIKPEVVAPGVNVWAQHPDGNFYPFNGTSYATPLTSGACCLIRQAHPEATVQQIRAAVMKTANNSQSPNNIYGWGRLNDYAAALELGPIAHIIKSWYSDGLHVCAGVASNNSGLEALLVYSLQGDTTERIARMSRVKDSLIYVGVIRGLNTGTRGRYWVRSVDDKGANATTPKIDFVIANAGVLRAQSSSQTNSLLELSANFPGTWSLIDITGRTVRTLVTHVPQSQLPITTCDIPSGVYFLRFAAENGEVLVTKVVVSH